MSASFAAPSSIEYSLWTWRCTKESDAMRSSLDSTSDGRARVAPRSPTIGSFAEGLTDPADPSDPRRNHRCSASGGSEEAVAQKVDGVLEVGRVGRRERHALARRGVLEAELVRVQPLAREAEPLRERRVGSVQRVADARMPVRGHVDADLVRAARLEVHFEERGARERL